jgi:hypothetical protein
MGILEQAESVELKGTPEQRGDESNYQPGSGPATFIDKGLTFADPQVITDMMYHLGIDPSALNSDTITKMKEIYMMSKNQSLPLDEYLVEKGRRIGGKMTPGFLGRLYVYLNTLDRENKLRKQLSFVEGERSIYEGHQNA